MVLLDVDREALGTGQLLAGGDLHVLVGDHAVQCCVVTDKNVKITAGKKLSGTESFPVYVQKNHTV